MRLGRKPMRNRVGAWTKPMGKTRAQISEIRSTPVSLLRWRAGADARRRGLEGKLLGMRLSDPERENLIRWLCNLETREAWAKARLEHIVAMKRIITEAITSSGPATRDYTQPPNALVEAEEEE